MSALHLCEVVCFSIYNRDLMVENRNVALPFTTVFSLLPPGRRLQGLTAGGDAA